MRRWRLVMASGSGVVLSAILFSACGNSTAAPATLTGTAGQCGSVDSLNPHPRIPITLTSDHVTKTYNVRVELPFHITLPPGTYSASEASAVKPVVVTLGSGETKSVALGCGSVG
jgi:hypothetical protein